MIEANKISIGGISLYNTDVLQLMGKMPDNSVNLIISDPPYYKATGAKWDHQWSSETEYLEWLDKVITEYWRILSPNGSLYNFCSPKLNLETEQLIRKRYNVLNNITWVKTDGYWKKQKKDNLSRYISASEKVIFAEHYDKYKSLKNEKYSLVNTNNLKCPDFSPIINYFREELKKTELTIKDVVRYFNSYGCAHWFQYSQWALPNEQQYIKLNRLFNEKAKLKVNKNAILTRKHASLVKEYNNIRRHFTVSNSVAHTDVWLYDSVRPYKGKHPCEKPAKMMRDIINASSRVGEVVFDPFMGSGSVLKQALTLGRLGIGAEFDKARFLKTAEEIKTFQ